MRDLPAPTDHEREVARKAAADLRAVIAGEKELGFKTTIHIDYSRPRRGEWRTTWENLPGLVAVNGGFQHDCLPGWEYTRAEVRSEMIADLETLARDGVRPTESTR